MSGTPPARDEDELLAAELAFGLLDASERQAAEARLAGDAPFAAAYRRWEAHAATLATGRGRSAAAVDLVRDRSAASRQRHEPGA